MLIVFGLLDSSDESSQVRTIRMTTIIVIIMIAITRIIGIAILVIIVATILVDTSTLVIAWMEHEIEIFAEVIVNNAMSIIPWYSILFYFIENGREAL